jgi:hypothetical protein
MVPSMYRCTVHLNVLFRLNRVSNALQMAGLRKAFVSDPFDLFRCERGRCSTYSFGSLEEGFVKALNGQCCLLRREARLCHFCSIFELKLIRNSIFSPFGKKSQIIMEIHSMVHKLVFVELMYDK